MKKALFIRMDRLGDLVLTLPCDQRVRDTHEVHWLIPKGLEFVLEASDPVRPYRSSYKKASVKNLWQLFVWFRQLRPEVSVSFHVPWWINALLFLARVPKRAGVLSQWHSYLFLNKGVRQKRSQVQAHELEYNFELTEKAFDLPTDKSQWHSLSLRADESQAPLPRGQEYYVVHPGMGGSALNWPTENYLQLIRTLSQRAPVVITGTVSDEPYLAPLREALKGHPQVVWLDGQLQGPRLLALLKNAIAMIAPSTGVLHLGASLGAASYGIYSPIKVHTAKRWGPKGPKAQTIDPQLSCPAQFECLGRTCVHFNCMASLSPERLLRMLPVPPSQA